MQRASGLPSPLPRVLSDGPALFFIHRGSVVRRCNFPNRPKVRANHSCPSWCCRQVASCCSRVALTHNFDEGSGFCRLARRCPGLEGPVGSCARPGPSASWCCNVDGLRGRREAGPGAAADTGVGTGTEAGTGAKGGLARRCHWLVLWVLLLTALAGPLGPPPDCTGWSSGSSHPQQCGEVENFLNLSEFYVISRDVTLSLHSLGEAFILEWEFSNLVQQDTHLLSFLGRCV